MEVYFKQGKENKKKLQKVIERIIRDSKVSMKKNSKNFNRVEKFCEKV